MMTSRGRAQKMESRRVDDTPTPRNGRSQHGEAMVDWKIPGALNPAPEPIWLVILAMTALVALVLRGEANERAEQGG